MQIITLDYEMMMMIMMMMFRADMWAILGIWAVQDGIDNSNDDCTDCGFTVPDIEDYIDYTSGRVV